MVKVFSETEALQIEQAVACAEKNTHAEIATVVLPISDRYISEMMFYGFVLGSVLAFILWEMQWAIHFPQFFLIQLFCILFVPFIPGLNRIFIYFLPKKLLFHRAVHIGAEELLAVMQNTPPNTPVVLLFISTAEHYIHLFPSPIVKNKIKDEEWEVLIQSFTQKLKQKGLTGACVETVNEIGRILAEFFPDDGGKNWYQDTVIHKGCKTSK